MEPKSDTELLDFLIQDGGTLSSNQGYGYVYWYPTPSRTKIIEGRTAREALTAAFYGEKGG